MPEKERGVVHGDQALRGVLLHYRLTSVIHTFSICTELLLLFVHCEKCICMQVSTFQNNQIRLSLSY